MIPFISSHLIKMADISSKFCHCAPPLLRAFDLSNQLSLSLHQNSKAATFSHHGSVILTKSPSFPPLSFRPKNPPFGHFPSIVSDERMPSDEWRHHMLSIANFIDPSATVSASAISFLWDTSHNSSAAAAVADEDIYGRSDACDELELPAKEITENTLAAALLSSPTSSPSPTPSLTLGTDSETMRVRERREMEDFILKMEEERRQEVAALAERQLVSRSLFRGCSKSLIRLRSSQQEVVIIRRQQWLEKLETERFEIESNHFFLRKRLVDKSRQDINEIPTEENMINMEVEPSDFQVLAFDVSIDHSDSKDNHFPELVFIRDIKSSPKTFYSPHTFFTIQSQLKDQEEDQSFDALWEEKSLWGRNLDLQRASYSHMPRTWHDEIASKRKKMATKEQHVASTESYWLLQPSNSRMGWG